MLSCLLQLGKHILTSCTQSDVQHKYARQKELATGRKVQNDTQQDFFTEFVFRIGVFFTKYD